MGESVGWKETCPVKERVRFVSAWEEEWEECEGRANMAALCRAFGVSRVTGYKWIKRYVDGGRRIDDLRDRSRRPGSSPSATSAEWVELVLAARRRHPRWGSRKLYAWMRRQIKAGKWLRRSVSLREMPKASTITAILRRHGLTLTRKPRQRVPAFTQPFASCNGPNDTWCVDFKGHFKTSDGTRVYPLTIMDAFSRFLIRCELVLDPDGKAVTPIFESAFAEFGLPSSIRSDNGPPFASKAPGGLTALSAWWTRLGIRHERITPGKPQENGRLERMHLTLKIETAMPPAGDPLAQQYRFDRFRKIYNDERPHEALENEVPRTFYRRSKRSLPAHLPRIEYPAFWEERRVEKDGGARLFRSKVHVGPGLYGEVVGFQWAGERRWEVFYGPVLLGLYDEDRPQKGLLRIQPETALSPQEASSPTTKRGRPRTSTQAKV